MGKYGVPLSESDFVKYAKESSSLDELMKKLKQLDGKTAGDLLGLEKIPDSLGLEKLEFEALSEDEIKNQSENKLSDDYKKRLEALGREFADKRAELEGAKGTVSSEGEQLRKKLDENYTGAKKNVSDDALKRGLARSSIVASQLGNLEQARAAGAGEIDKKVSEQIAELGERISKLSGELAGAVDEENLSHAKQLADEIKSLKAEQDKRKEEVVKYNNTVSEKESKYKLDSSLKYADKLSDVLTGSSAEKAEKLRSYEKAVVIRDYLDKLTPDAAMALLKSDADVKAAAGEYYNYLYNYVELKKQK